MPSTQSARKIPHRLVRLPPINAPPIVATTPSVPGTNPIWTGVNCRSTQKGLIMGPMAISPSLKVKTKAATARKPGRAKNCSSGARMASAAERGGRGCAVEVMASASGAREEIMERRPISTAAPMNTTPQPASPEELERPWEPNQAQQADIREAHALQTQVDGDGIHDQAERKAFGEVQRGDPDELLTCAHDRSVSLCRNDGKAGLCLIACLGKIVKRAWVVLIRRRVMVYSVYSR